MSRRAALVTQADVARALRAARQAGATAVEVQTDGRILIRLDSPSIAPEPQDPFDEWKQENEARKAARRRERV
jgi:hypothetical protein